MEMAAVLAAAATAATVEAAMKAAMDVAAKVAVAMVLYGEGGFSDGSGSEIGGEGDCAGGGGKGGGTAAAGALGGAAGAKGTAGGVRRVKEMRASLCNRRSRTIPSRQNHRRLPPRLGPACSRHPESHKTLSKARELRTLSSSGDPRPAKTANGGGRA